MKIKKVHPQPQLEHESGRYTPAVTVGGQAYICPGYPLMGYEKALKISESVARLAQQRGNFEAVIWTETDELQNSYHEPSGEISRGRRVGSFELWVNGIGGFLLAAIIVFIIMLIMIAIVNDPTWSEWLNQPI